MSALVLGLAVPACLVGNQELVERKTTELHCINEQVAKQAAPAGLKEGESVEVKANLRVERTAEKTPVVRDVKVESVKISGKPAAAPAKPAAPAAGAGKNKESEAAGKKSDGSTPGVRQERLDIPPVNEKRKE